MIRPPWNWTDDAACTRHPHIDWTIEPTETVSRDEVAEVREAAANICASCPVRNWCATDAEAARRDPDETCRPFGVRAGLFYDGTRREPSPLMREAHVRALCGIGLTDGQIGVKIGLTERQVRDIRNRLGLPSTVTRQMPPPRPFRHGTKSGYLAHKRRGETACDDCRAGLNAYNRAWAARRRNVA